MVACLAELEKDPEKFLRNLENGDTVWYKSDLVNYPEVGPVEVKQRECDEQREFLGNYKTSLCKEEALQKVIGGDLEDGLVSGPFSESELRGKYPRVVLNSSGEGLKDLTWPDVGTLVDSTHGGRPSHSSNNAAYKT